MGGTGLGERAEDLLALAAAALERGDWADARDAYQLALAVGEDAATLEGLAYACWWLRDDAITIDSRRKAFRLYLDAGDTVSAARIAISLARDHILQGERSVANGWVLAAELTLSPTHTAAWDLLKEDSGLALRFPRFTGRWRDDKAAEDATIVEEVVAMFQAARQAPAGA